MAYRLVRRDAVDFINANHLDITRCWASLLSRTTIPIQCSISDDAILSAFKAVDLAVAENGMGSRLAHIRLLSMFESLATIIKRERRGDMLGRRVMSIIYDRYTNAQDKPNRSYITERNRIAKRWRMLAGPSALLLFLYSDTADLVVYVDALPNSYVSLTSPAMTFDGLTTG
ncbi:hypothetical protein B0I35DRAFT_447623 [Stachybotrys elegans]|uniref:Uncharacterized protein n=1 Tax=Stachybotrys elegans TaxID=80388 RepID=A0A8K0SAS8_9HYPO|nr:hypothetical protein B0I35DRAFT_447623 [Stachybotrys elegans]